MPWCDTCERLVDDAEVTDDDRCPTCAEPFARDRPPVPWHFRLLLAATVIYLGYRTYQGIGWLVHHA